MIGLYLVEMILKYALDNAGRAFRRTHNLSALFNSLPPSSKRSSEREYARVKENAQLRQNSQPREVDTTPPNVRE